ncbi:hypothetical protein [Moorena producens]|nr:hypothetical protein [Moorena producens]
MLRSGYFLGLWIRSGNFVSVEYRSFSGLDESAEGKFPTGEGEL